MFSSFRVGQGPPRKRTRIDSPPPAIPPDPTTFTTPQGRLLTPAKSRIILWSDQKESVRGIQRKLFKHCGVQTSTTTISRVITSRNTRRQKPPGRPPRFTQIHAAFARQMIAQGSIYQRMSLSAFRDNFLPQFSTRTIQRGLSRWYGMGRLQALKRIPHLPPWWERVIWTDEVIFSTTRQGRIWITRAAEYQVLRMPYS